MSDYGFIHWATGGQCGGKKEPFFSLLKFLANLHSFNMPFKYLTLNNENGDGDVESPPSNVKAMLQGHGHHPSTTKPMSFAQLAGKPKNRLTRYHAFTNIAILLLTLAAMIMLSQAIYHFVNNMNIHNNEDDLKFTLRSKMDYSIDKSVVNVCVRNVIDFCNCTNVTVKFPDIALIHREDVPHPFDCAAWDNGHLDDDAFTELFGEGSVLGLLYRYSRYICNGIDGDCFHKTSESAFNEVPEALAEYSQFIWEATYYKKCKIGYVIEDTYVKVRQNMSKGLEIVIDEIVTKADRDRNRPPTVTNEEIPWLSRCGNKKVGGFIEVLCERYRTIKVWKPLAGKVLPRWNQLG